jgi:predicted glycosyltransferase
MTARVAFLVTHLAGSGHLVRTLALARAVAAAGGEATVISGGRPLPHLDPGPVRLAQLPPLRVEGGDYGRPLDADGAEATPALMAARAAGIAAELAARPPDTLVTELHPFGRRALRAEFGAAVAQARSAGARVVASVRDVPEPPRKAARVAEAHAALRADFAFALVHGDPALIPFEAGWPGAAAVADLLRPTGYVADPAPPPAGDPDEVQVSEGGGALGRRLLAAAVGAAALDGRRWRLRVGGADAGAEVARLRALAAAAGVRDRVTVVPVGPDHRARLGVAAASVSLCGYNTAVDLMATGVPAVVVPFADGAEREQVLRARAMADRGLVETLNAGAPTPAALAAAVALAVARGRRTGPPPVALDGAEVSARLLLGR